MSYQFKKALTSDIGRSNSFSSPLVIVTTKIARLPVGCSGVGDGVTVGVGSTVGSGVIVGVAVGAIVGSGVTEPIVTSVISIQV